MKESELKTILSNHQHWIKEDCDGWENMRANLSGVDLSGADLRGADIRRATLYNADLRRTDLRGADLRWADFNNANLRGAYLNGAGLHCADLSNADLRNTILSNTDLRLANLNCADLRNANLYNSDLRNVGLYNANLRSADLSCVDLSGADLRGTDLRDADLRWAKLNDVNYNEHTTCIAMQCPETGSFIGYKKVNGYIVKLEVPYNARRSSATSRKCRCEFAKVLSITNTDGSDSGLTCTINHKYCETTYHVGEMVCADKWDDNRWNECSHGIHLFITRQEAVNY